MKKFLLLCLCLALAGPAFAASTNIEDLGGGQVALSVTYPSARVWAEVFIKKNGMHIFAGGIMASARQNADGSVTYRHVHGGFQQGDRIEYRYYSYPAGGAGEFTPGPGESVWLAHAYDGSAASTQDPVADGQSRFSVRTAIQQAYVEIFIRKNGAQIFAGAITASGKRNEDGTWTYTHVQDGFRAGDRVEVRFYHYATGGGGQFTPGPSSGTWEAFTYSSPVASADIIFVTPSGNDANPGTQASPVATIRRALAVAATRTGSDRQIHIAGGTYNEVNLTVLDGVDVMGGYAPDFSRRDITAYPTVIDAGQAPNQMCNGNYRVMGAVNITSPTVIEGLTLQRGKACGTSTPYSHGGGLMIVHSTSALVVRNNIIRDNQAAFGAVGGNVYLGSSSAIVTGNTILNGFSGGGIGGADLHVVGAHSSGAAPRVSGNVFSSNGTTRGFAYVDAAHRTNTNADGTPHVPETMW